MTQVKTVSFKPVKTQTILMMILKYMKTNSQESFYSTFKTAHFKLLFFIDQNYEHRASQPYMKVFGSLLLTIDHLISSRKSLQRREALDVANFETYVLLTFMAPIARIEHANAKAINIPINLRNWNEFCISFSRRLRSATSSSVDSFDTTTFLTSLLIVFLFNELYTLWHVFDISLEWYHFTWLENWTDLKAHDSSE